MFTRTIRPTGEKLTVARPEELGADASEGKWVTFCEDHKTLVYSATQQLAYDTRGADFCDDCHSRIAINPTNRKVNLNDHKEARAYQEGFQGAFDLLITMLEEGGDTNYLLEGIEHNARPDIVARMNAFYAGKAPIALPVQESTDYTRLEFTNKKDALLAAKAQGGPVDVEVENPKRGKWVVTITPKAVA